LYQKLETAMNLRANTLQRQWQDPITRKDARTREDREELERRVDEIQASFEKRASPSS